MPGVKSPVTIALSAQAGVDAVRRDPVLELQRDLKWARDILLGGFAVGLLTLGALWGWHVLTNGYTVFFWALACFVLGGLLGFLFGIPRVMQNDLQSEGTRSKTDPKAAVFSRSTYQLAVNTNLDDVSDWLTKIVVGVGLVELREIPGLLLRLARLIAGELGVNQVPFIIAVIAYFTTVGFMSGYLTTRMFFQRVFRIADLYALGALDERGPEAQIATADPVTPPDPEA
jgi:hypothetical protein